MPDGALQQELASAFGQPVSAVRRVSGGCISTTLRVSFADGTDRFVKLAPAGPAGGDVLDAEAHALVALRATHTVRVPAVLAQGEGWLALEWLAPGSGGKAAWSQLGRQLGELHRSTAGARIGWDRDNYIGTLPQANSARASWPEYWRENRLEPQLRAAAGHFDARARGAFDALFDLLPELLAAGADEGASLLHGDLWSGNVHLLAAGGAALIDPSSYCGHREVDLAMAALFGGFDAAFWDAYEQCWPVTRAGLERRRAAYQLYYLLVHVNLFGAGYVAQTLSALERSLSPRPARG